MVALALTLVRVQFNTPLTVLVEVGVVVLDKTVTTLVVLQLLIGSVTVKL